jgi:hypothetical protein
MIKTELCACGKPLHYRSPKLQAEVEKLIAANGSVIPVRIADRSDHLSGVWLVPRHYIALHGLIASELPKLKFPQVLVSGELRVHYKYDSGTTLCSDQPNRSNERFVHTDETGQVRHFHIAKLKTLLNQMSVRLCSVDITEPHVAFVLENGGIDQAYVEQMDTTFINEPGIICEFDDTTQLQVDGNHRLIKRSQMGLASMEFWVVPEAVWRKCLLNLHGTDF